MSDEDSRARLSWQSMVDSKITELVEKMAIMEERSRDEITKLKRCISLLSTVSFHERAIIMRISGYFNFSKGDMSFFNAFIENFKRRNEIVAELTDISDIQVSRLEDSYILSWIISYGKKWGIEFSQLASYMKRQLREDVYLVEREDILKHYGVDELDTWDRLIKR